MARVCKPRNALSCRDDARSILQMTVRAMLPRFALVDFTVDRISGACPTQAEGRLADGRPFYFRARGGDWSVFVGPSGSDAGGEWIGLAAHLFAVGDDPTEGRMTDSEVGAVLESVFQSEA
jgi:hypothetical protein